MRRRKHIGPGDTVPLTLSKRAHAVLRGELIYTSRELEDKLSHRLDRRVRIRPRGATGRGEIVINFNSLDDFDQLIGKLFKE